MNRIRWLHLTDLHFGHDALGWLWPRFKRQFYEDLRITTDAGGKWDLVIFSGDIVNTGALTEYESVTSELILLWEHFRALGSNPLLIAVPGNHDVQRPSQTDPVCRTFRRWHDSDNQDVRNLFWSSTPNPYRDLVQATHQAYEDWLEHLPLPKPAFKKGLLPGDFSTTIEHGGLKLGIVGLNSTFLQMSDGDYSKLINLHPKQLMEVTNGDPDKWCSLVELSLLVTHHPPSWLHPDALVQFNNEIYPPGRFHAHYCGHLHEPVTRTTQEEDGVTRRLRQGASLFGLERWGTETTDRIHGYASGGVDIDEDSGKEVMWPRRVFPSYTGVNNIGPDTHYKLDAANRIVWTFSRPSAHAATKAVLAIPPPFREQTPKVPTQSDNRETSLSAYIPILDTKFPLPLVFQSVLPFTTEDREEMPWLAGRFRYYAVDTQLKDGGHSVVYKGHVASIDGTAFAGTRPIVLKLPNIDPDGFPLDEVRDFMRSLEDDYSREWQLTRKRLHGCKFANPVFDLEVFHVHHRDEFLNMPVTCQHYLDDAEPLEGYLLRTGQRAEPYRGSREPVDNWRGMTPAGWTELARAIALGLADIHLRRVVHGDICPSNVFIRVQSGIPVPIFIDFSKAFPFEPHGSSKEQSNQPYRAPERRDRQSIVTQHSDVYSLGKLLLHLAIGEEPIIDRQLTGHDRTDFIRQRMLARNPAMISDNPFILNIISKCLAVDPVDRPRVSSVAAALSTYADPASYSRVSVSIPAKLNELKQKWERLMDIHPMRSNTLLDELIVQRMDRVGLMIDGLQGDVVSVSDTRDHLIVAMMELFRGLQKGDRFLSLTSPRMWQGACLGLDGRYFSSAILAIAREASIIRTFAVSVQELGKTWTESLARRLEIFGDESGNSDAKAFSSSLFIAIRQFERACETGEAHILSKSAQTNARSRLSLVMKSYADAHMGTCKGAFNHMKKFSSAATWRGSYIGILPVSTLGALQALKAAHPVAVFYYGQEKRDDQYLLMMTDCLARNSNFATGEGLEPQLVELPNPELRGLTVFKSVLGVPESRIKSLEEEVFANSFSIGYWINQFSDILITSTAE